MSGFTFTVDSSFLSDDVAELVASVDRTDSGDCSAGGPAPQAIENMVRKTTTIAGIQGNFNGYSFISNLGDLSADDSTRTLRTLIAQFTTEYRW